MSNNVMFYDIQQQDKRPVEFSATSENSCFGQEANLSGNSQSGNLTSDLLFVSQFTSLHELMAINVCVHLDGSLRGL
jgi:hypothetical protein